MLICILCVYVCRSQNTQRSQHWTAPVPMPSLRPPSEWLARRSRSQTVSSTQASFRSSALKPSYTIVWLNMGLAVLFSTRVFWRLFLLVSGSTKLCREFNNYLVGPWRCFHITIIQSNHIIIPFHIWVNSWTSDKREILAVFDPDMHFTRARNVLCWIEKINTHTDQLINLWHLTLFLT